MEAPSAIEEGNRGNSFKRKRENRRRRERVHLQLRVPEHGKGRLAVQQVSLPFSGFDKSLRSAV